MRLDEYESFDATGLAQLVRSKEVSASEVQQAGTAAIQSVNPTLNAVVEGPFDSPLDYASTGYFAGVPFVIKDGLCHAAGVPTYLGSRLSGGGVRHENDTILMSRFKAAGLATIATTRTPEFALSLSTEPLRGGATRNPWDTSRSPGGSSGGSAALVAAGAVPIGHANDAAGSIRGPAAHTGLVGLKPSRGRIPLGPDVQESAYGLTAEFALTRTVRDTAALLDAVAGWAPGEKFSEPPRENGAFSDDVGADPGRLRIAIDVGSWTAHKTDIGVREATEAVAHALEKLGHTVVFAAPEIDWSGFIPAIATAWSATAAASVGRLAQQQGLPVDLSTVEMTTLRLVEHGRRVTSTELAGTFAVYNMIGRQFGQFLEEWDVWLTPTSTNVAPLVGELDMQMDHTPEEWVAKCTDPYPFATVFNVTGAPAISVPAGRVDGLPVGVQLGAQVGREALLLRLAAQIEEAMPWAAAVPDLRVGTEVAY